MRYYKEINGEIVFFTGKVLYTDAASILNPTEELLLEAGWLIWNEPELTQEEFLEVTRTQKLEEIENYDLSDAVNIFMLGSTPMWLDALTRQQLRISIEAYLATGAELVTKWFMGEEFTFPISLWLQMLNALEVYAAEALNVTEAHKAYINSLDNIEEIQEFDITQGYPQILNLMPR